MREGELARVRRGRQVGRRDGVEKRGRETTLDQPVNQNRGGGSLDEPLVDRDGVQAELLEPVDVTSGV
jgi:hypothetical protein